MNTEKLSNEAEPPAFNKGAVSGCTGIKVETNPFNDPRWGPPNEIKMKYPLDTLRCYELEGKRVVKISFKKPKQNKCRCIVCFNGIAHGVRAYKVMNWDELPDLPEDLSVIEYSYFERVKVKIV